MSTELEQLKKQWKKSKWYSEAGEKKVAEQFDCINSSTTIEKDPKVYCNNIRKACKNISEAFEDISRAEIVVEDDAKD